MDESLGESLKKLLLVTPGFSAFWVQVPPESVDVQKSPPFTTTVCFVKPPEVSIHPHSVVDGFVLSIQTSHSPSNRPWLRAPIWEAAEEMCGECVLALARGLKLKAAQSKCYELGWRSRAL